MMAKEPRAAESTHWYTRDGVPMYTVPSKKDGSPRNTTLRDARTLNLVPSVTTVLKVINAPALTQWLIKQAILSSLTLPRLDGEQDDLYVERILSDSKEEGRAAANKGTEIHEAVQGFYEGKGYGAYPAEVAASASKIFETFGHQEWIAERPFSHELGFGGKCDLHAPSDDGIVIDAKSKEFGVGESPVGYDEHKMQLAAYRVGLGIPRARCANLFVSRTVPGLAVIYEWEEADLKQGWEMFTHALNFWQARNKHR